MVNVGKYTIHGRYGLEDSLNIFWGTQNSGRINLFESYFVSHASKHVQRFSMFIVFG